MNNLNLNVQAIIKRIEEISGLDLSVTDDYTAILTGSSVTLVALEQLGLVKLNDRLIDDMDVDIFCIDSSYQPEINRTDGDVVDIGRYGPFAKQLRGYSLEYTMRSGLLNVTFVGGYAYKPHILDAALSSKETEMSLHEKMISRLIAAFDVNAVQIGICLQDMEIHYTRYFEYLCTTGQLIAVNIDTIPYTLMRLEKKSQQLNRLSTSLNFYVNEKATRFAMELAHSAILHNLELHYKDVKESLRLATKAVETHSRKEEGQLGMFDEDSLEYNKNRQEYLKMDLEFTARNIEFHEKITSHHYLKTNTYKPSWLVINEDRSTNLRRLEMKGQTRPIDDVRRIAIGIQLQKRKRSKYSFLAEAITGSTTFTNRVGYEIKAFRIQYESIPNREYKKNRIRKMFHKLDYHQILGTILELSEGEMDTGIKMCNNVLTLEKKYGTWAIGTIETAVFRANSNESVRSLLLNMETMTSIVEREKVMMEGQIREPIFPQQILDRFGKMRELLSRKELMEEGDTMHHCVGGYSEKVFLGSIILSIASPERCTCEISRKNGTGKYKMVQVRSYHNDSVSRDTDKTCKTLARTLNKLIEKGVITPPSMKPDTDNV